MHCVEMKYDNSVCTVTNDDSERHKGTDEQADALCALVAMAISIAVSVANSCCPNSANVHGIRKPICRVVTVERRVRR